MRVTLSLTRGCPVAMLVIHRQMDCGPLNSPNARRSYLISTCFTFDIVYTLFRDDFISICAPVLLGPFYFYIRINVLMMPKCFT